MAGSLGCTVIALLTLGGCGMCNGDLAKWQGCRGLASMDGLDRLGLPLVGLGMQDFGSDGPEKACSVCGCWDCQKSIVAHGTVGMVL